MTYKSINTLSSDITKLFDWNLDLFDEFDRAFSKVGALSIAASSYPPSNVIKTDTGYRIELALAGWNEENLKVTLSDPEHSDNPAKHLSIVGTNESESQETAFVHKGISQRKFTKTFIVPELSEVSAVTFKNGLLIVEIEIPKPEVPEKQTKEFKIGFTKK